ncbi:MAG TPA: hypothetical protein VF407_09120 [Polyangiaceae bacterium]
MNPRHDDQQSLDNETQLEEEWRAKIQRALRDLRSMTSEPSPAKAS